MAFSNALFVAHLSTSMVIVWRCRSYSHTNHDPCCSSSSLDRCHLKTVKRFHGMMCCETTHRVPSCAVLPGCSRQTVVLAALIGMFSHVASCLLLSLIQIIVHPAQVGIKPHIAISKIIVVNIRPVIKYMLENS
jgi:hypothetical protein